jgi:hypothetical protein
MNLSFTSKKVAKNDFKKSLSVQVILPIFQQKVIFLAQSKNSKNSFHQKLRFDKPLHYQIADP